MSTDLQAAMEFARPMVSRILRRHRHAVDDVLSEAALKAFVRQDQFQGDAKFSTYFYSIARNESLMFLRANKREFFSLDNALNVPSKTLSPEAQVIQREHGQILRRAIETLSPKRKQAAYLALNEIGPGNSPAFKAARFTMRRVLREALTNRGLK